MIFTIVLFIILVFQIFVFFVLLVLCHVPSLGFFLLRLHEVFWSSKTVRQVGSKRDSPVPHRSDSETTIDVFVREGALLTSGDEAINLPREF